jgi:hypothetical protein
MKRQYGIGILLAAAMSAAPAVPAMGQGGLHVANYGSGLCLEVVPYFGNYYLNGLSVMQTYCLGSDSSSFPQRWKLEFVGQGGIAGRAGSWNLYHLANATNGECLDDKDGNTADRAPVQVWPCNGTSTTMKWTLGITRDGFTEFINARSGKCLDIPAASTTPGALVQQYHCSTSSTVTNYAQLFAFTP